MDMYIYKSVGPNDVRFDTVDVKQKEMKTYFKQLPEEKSYIIMPLCSIKINETHPF